MKLLLYCATYDRDGLDEFWPDSEESFYALKAPEGVEVTRVVGRDNPYDNRTNRPYRNTLHQFQKAQRMALDGGYDGLVTFESDMIVPEDGLIRLLETLTSAGKPAEVVYGLYMLRHGTPAANAMRKLGDSPNIDQSLSYFPELYNQGMRAGRMIVSGLGNGFTLIRRSVLERFPLRNWDEINFAPDWALASDCLAAGIEQICLFDLKCGHITSDGRVLWPREMAGTVKVLVRETFTKGVVYTAGETAEMPPDDAKEMSRCGFVQILGADGGPEQMATPRRAWVEEAVVRPAERAVTRGKRK